MICRLQLSERFRSVFIIRFSILSITYLIDTWPHVLTCPHLHSNLCKLKLPTLLHHVATLVVSYETPSPLWKEPYFFFFNGNKQDMTQNIHWVNCPQIEISLLQLLPRICQEFCEPLEALHGLPLHMFNMSEILQCML